MRTRLVGLLAFSTGVVTGAVGDAAGVPSLAAQPADYCGYAIDDLPQHFRGPQLNQLDNTPANNPITDAGAELGRVLFYDARLSHNNGTACASCHTQETGFTDPNRLSEGFEGGLTGRHSMALSNARWHRNRDGEGRFFWDEWAAAFGLSDGDVSGPLAADGNGDGDVNAADYVVWRNNLGARWDDALTALAEAVPEPSGAVVLLCLVGLSATRRR